MIFAIRSPAGGICRSRGLVSGQENSVPEADVGGPTYFGVALDKCRVMQRMRSLSDLFSKTSPLSFVVAHYNLLAVKALQVTGFRSLANARHFCL